MPAVDVQQGSGEWLQMRAGRVTGSKMADVLSRLKNGGETADRKNYKAQIVAEILTGNSAQSYVSPEMQWGTEQEPFARAAYEAATGVFVDQVGFYIHPAIERAGGSPDGLVGVDGAIEIKCGKTATHIRWALADEVPPEHEPQMMFYLACTGRKWMDFVSFDPRVSPRYQLFIKRLQRDESRIADINAAVEQFLVEVDLMIEQLDARFPALPEPLATHIDTLDVAGLTEEDFKNLI